jgi:hypothetical protein
VAENSEKQRASSERKRGSGRPFQPGQSGNPGGRPKSFAALVRERTDDGAALVDYAIRVHSGLEVSLEDAKTMKERVAVAQLRLDAGRWLASYGFGQPIQHLEHAGEGGGLLQIIVKKRGEG